MGVEGKRRLTNVRITSSNSSLWYLIHCATMTYLFGSTVNWRAHWNRSIGRSNWQNVKRRSNVRRAKGWCHAFQLDSILFTDWRSPLDGIEDAIVGLDTIAAQMERPIHGKEDIVVYHIGFVIFASFFGIQSDDVDDFSDAKTTTSIRPCNMSLEEECYDTIINWISESAEFPWWWNKSTILRIFSHLTYKSLCILGTLAECLPTASGSDTSTRKCRA